MRNPGRIIFLLPIAILLLTAVISCSDDDESEKAGETKAPSVTLDSFTAAAQLAVYSQIDSGFQLLKPVFERSCFDCHSQKTKFPWYAKLPGVKQFLSGHIEEGRKELDMTNGFPFSGKGEPIQLLHRMHDEIDEGGMPLWSYRLMHWGTKIEGTRKDSVVAWLDSSITRLQAFDK